MFLKLYDAAHRFGLDHYADKATGGSPNAIGEPTDTSHTFSGQPVVGDRGSFSVAWTSGLVLSMEGVLSDATHMTLSSVTMSDRHTGEQVFQLTGEQPLDLETGELTAEDRLLFAEDDTLAGNAYGNLMQGWGGNDQADGLGGTDTWVVSGSRAAYDLVRSGAAITLKGVDGTDALSSFERIEFDDGGIAFDVDGTAGQAYRLYQAAFDRAPDVPGLGYQMRALDSGLSLGQVAAHFIASPEFQSTYGALSDAAFVRELYDNVLGREPEAQGLAYHVARLEQGAGRENVLAGFSESPENATLVIGSISAGMVYGF